MPPALEGQSLNHWTTQRSPTPIPIFSYSHSAMHTLSHTLILQKGTRSGLELTQGDPARQEQRWGLKQRQCKDFLGESSPQPLRSPLTNYPTPMDVFT